MQRRANSSAILLELPVAVIERANLPRLQPAADAVEVERVVAHTPRNRALVRCRGCLVGLALDAQVHDVVAADRAIIHDNICACKPWHGARLAVSARQAAQQSAAGSTAENKESVQAKCSGSAGRRGRWRKAPDKTARMRRIPQAQRLTADHFFTTKRFSLGLGALAAPPPASTSMSDISRGRRGGEQGLRGYGSWRQSRWRAHVRQRSSLECSHGTATRARTARLLRVHSGRRVDPGRARWRTQRPA